MRNLPGPGTVLHGFKVLSKNKIECFFASTTELFHEASRATVLCIENEDPELGFSIIYRTPQLDETDACHMAEHLVLSSCRKYRSRDIFFDMDSKSYSTFMNGMTDTCCTCYPFCSVSQKQLIKLMDVALCCMEEPDALTEPFFFDREALRFELKEADGPLTLSGTVLGEDWAHLTDLEENADSHTARTLYPDSLASRLPGRAHFHYSEISRERTLHILKEYYQYSNCLILLYGKMDFEAVLSFLHQEHLSHYPARQSPVSPAFFQEPVLPGFRSSEEKSPAYLESRTDEASVIDFALDLSAASGLELFFWDQFAQLLDNSASPLHQEARAQGLNHVIQVYVDTLLIHPVLKFRLLNGDAGVKEAFFSVIRSSLQEVSVHGLSRELCLASVRESRMTDSLTREGVHLGCHAAEEIGRYWSLTGKTDYFPLYEQAFREFSADALGEQSLIRSMASEALSPAASALTVTVPSPGLAEKLEQEKKDFLSRQKASMSPRETDALLLRSREFALWNERELTNQDFLIHPGELPAPAAAPAFFQADLSGIEGYFSPVPGALCAGFQLYFDLGFLAKEDLPFLALYQLLLTEIDTPSCSSEKQKLLEQEFLHDCTFDEVFPEEEAETHSHPALSVFWYGFPEDFEKSLSFLLEIMGRADYTDTRSIIRALEKYTPDYDLSQGENAASLSYALAESALRKDARFRAAANNQDIYLFFQDTLRRLKEDPAFKEELALRLSETAARILTRSRMVFLAAAREEQLPSIQSAAGRILGLLPSIPGCAHSGNGCGPVQKGELLPSPIIRAAVSLDASSQEIRLIGDFSKRKDFKGRYLPFLTALSDKYLKPALRYRGGAYDCGIDVSLPNGYFSLWCTADPGLEETVRLFQAAGTALKEITLTQEELNGYILSAFSQAQPLSGPLNAGMRAMRRQIAGIRSEYLRELLDDIPSASLEDLEQASDVIQDIIDRGSLGAAGSRSAIDRAAGLFETVTHL